MRQISICSLFVSSAVLSAAPHAFGDWQTDAINANRRALNQIVDHHDAIINDIRNRNSSSSSSSGRPLDTRSAAQIRRDQEAWNRNWQQQVDEENADRDAWNAHVKAYSDRQHQIYLNNARIREEARAANEKYQQFRLAEKPLDYVRFLQAFEGMGTKEMPPVFSTDKDRFDWYLKQASAGDTFAAFWLGRAMLTGEGAAKNPPEGAKWMEKADLKMPLAATFLGALLVNGQWLPRDASRGRELLEFGAKNDVTGEGARLYGEILQAGIGLPKDEDAAALQFFRALDRSYTGSVHTVWEEYGWLEPAHIVAARKAKIAAQSRERVRADPSRVAQWLLAWESGKLGGDNRAFRMLMHEIDTADEKSARDLALQKLEYIEASSRYYERGAAIDRLIALNYYHAKPRALLPSDGEYLSLSKEDASDYWRTSSVSLEKWATEIGPLQGRARATLIAHDLGRWGDVAPPAPETLRAILAARSWDDAPKMLASEINRLELREVAGWTGGKAREFLQKLGALDATFQPALALYDAGAGLEIKNGDARKEIARQRFDQTIRDLQDGKETFSPDQLAAARLDFARAAGLQDAQPLAAFPLYLKALRGGDALAAWHLEAQFWFYASPIQNRWLLDTLDARLKRDVEGEGDGAATAAFALHLLHSEARGIQVYGRRVNRGWRPSKPDETDWLQVAIAKRHPWAIHFSNSNAAIKAANKYGAEDQKIWPWLAANFPTLSEKRDLWERDCRWLDMLSPAAEIAELQTPLSILEKSTSDAARFREVTARLPDTRQFCAVASLKPTPQDAKKAFVFYERALDAQEKDEDHKMPLPFNRASRLELMMQAAIWGHPVAPLQIVALLKEPQFPVKPNNAEAALWLPIAKARLDRSIKTGPVEEARRNAILLAQEFRSGEHFPKNDAEAVKYVELAAKLGSSKYAWILRGIYERGDLGVTKNAAMALKWEKVSEAIDVSKYKIPPELLVGRAKL